MPDRVQTLMKTDSGLVSDQGLSRDHLWANTMVDTTTPMQIGTRESGHRPADGADLVSPREGTLHSLVSKRGVGGGEEG